MCRAFSRARGRCVVANRQIAEENTIGTGRPDCTERRTVHRRNEIFVLSRIDATIMSAKPPNKRFCRSFLGKRRGRPEAFSLGTAFIFLPVSVWSHDLLDDHESIEWIFLLQKYSLDRQAGCRVSLKHGKQDAPRRGLQIRMFPLQNDLLFRGLLAFLSGLRHSAHAFGAAQRACAAFLARSLRCLAVILRAAFLPPVLPSQTGQWHTSSAPHFSHLVVTATPRF